MDVGHAEGVEDVDQVAARDHGVWATTVGAGGRVVVVDDVVAGAVAAVDEAIADAGVAASVAGVVGAAALALSSADALEARRTTLMTILQM